MIYVKRLLKRINNVSINTVIDLAKYNHSYLKAIKFTQESCTCFTHDIRGKYSWIANCTGSYSYRTIFPMNGTTYVAFFKTLKGAKGNFIRQHLK